jgi:hypothetical protein
MLGCTYNHLPNFFKVRFINDGVTAIVLLKYALFSSMHDD